MICGLPHDPCLNPSMPASIKSCRSSKSLISGTRAWCWGGIASLTIALAGCGPVEEKAGPSGGVNYVAPPVEARRNPTPAPEVHRWLEASTSVREQLSSLRKELAGLQQIHVENHFDDFLNMDPANLAPAQLCYLQHFLERGYFRIEREVLVQLLEARQARITRTQAAATGKDIAGRLEAALQRDETIIIDLETAIARYRTAGDEPFQIPEILTESGVASLRETVTAKLGAERTKIAGLNRKISELRGQSP